MYKTIVLAPALRTHSTNEYGTYKHLPTAHRCKPDNQLPMHNLYTYEDL